MRSAITRNLPLCLLCITAVVCCCTVQLKSHFSRTEARDPAEPNPIEPRLSGAKIQPLKGDQATTIPSLQVDGNVRLASTAANPLLLAIASTGVNGFAIESVSQHTNDLGVSLHWPVDGSTTTVYLASNSEVKIGGKGALPAGIIVDVDGVPMQPTKREGDVTNWSLTIPAKTATFTLTAENQTGRIRLVVPDNAIDTPQISRVSTNPFVIPSAGLTGRKIYGRYIRLEGELALPGTDLSFPVFLTDSGEFLGNAIPRTPVVQFPDGRWKTELLLPPAANLMKSYAQGFVTTIAKRGNIRRYSKQKVDFLVALTSPSPLAAPAITQIRKADDSVAGNQIQPADDIYRLSNKTFFVRGTAQVHPSVDRSDVRIVSYLDGRRYEGASGALDDSGNWTIKAEVENDKTYRVTAAAVIGNLDAKRSDPVIVAVRTTGPRVTSIVPSAPLLESITVTFNEPISVPSTATALEAAFQLVGAERTLNTTTIPTLDSNNSLELKFVNVPPGVYTFKVMAGEIANKFGLSMLKGEEMKVFQPIDKEDPPATRGITGPTGPFVPFPEYTKPRRFIDGFNPSDHVETRVSRLYFYRDAHRIAQIINRDVKSYNRAAVAMQEQLADKSRQIADQATDDRRSKERRAVEAARKTREAERELQQAEANAERAAAQAANAATDLRRRELALRNPNLTPPQRNELEADTNDLRNVIGRLEAVAASARGRVQSANEKVQVLREDESELTEDWQRSIAVEDRAREAQFRREVAAAHTDPDTYVPGKPGSVDPVRQVSVSVIGEGLIQLRGPIKGINIIRTMINQIDAPVGQVRIGVHSVQINGEHGDRMELVAEKIQRYIDHSRFLTLQSAEMLRKAIVQVAAQNAYDVGKTPGLTQEERDLRYLYAFFGEDFIHELRAMDSEFLMTGNKLLSIHSMDSTSLASAMFLMALAKNSTRLQILAEFERMMAVELPQAEQNYFEAGLTSDGKKKLFGKHCKQEEFQMLSENARFQSIRVFFDSQIANDHTMTPIQREFVRLAQIFKSRLIVEMELKQRIMERSVIEDRVGDYKQELDDAKQKEETALRQLDIAQTSIRGAQKQVLAAVQEVQVIAERYRDRSAEAQANSERAQRVTDKTIATIADDYFVQLLGGFENVLTAEEFRQLQAVVDSARKDLVLPLKKNELVGQRIVAVINEFRQTLRTFKNENIPLEKTSKIDPAKEASITMLPDLPVGDGISKPQVVTIDTKTGEMSIPQEVRNYLDRRIAATIEMSRKLKKQLTGIEYDERHKQLFREANALLDEITASERKNELENLLRSGEMLSKYAAVAKFAADSMGAVLDSMNEIVVAMSATNAQYQVLYRVWIQVAHNLARILSEIERAGIQSALNSVRESFQALLGKDLDYQFAIRDAEAARRPLDHKKFLDMLVDEMEDKYIELLEGTRAHTANIDAYIKRLMTSLDDDFNTQFYYPAFRHVRRASQLYDVQMGQVETTTILANNRAFAKVSPQATMEFDLPKRDIVIAEAINGAKATMDDIGALAADPTFLAMAQLQAGQPTSTQGGGASGGFSTVRNVLPGLSTDTAENVMSQQGPGGSQFGAALEALIPDPAIYKFETGTGFEIRPVIQPDGQAVVFNFNYMYTTNIREPVRADEKHLGRVKRHFINTDVQLSNFELREVSRYTVALKAARTSRGVPLLEDIPGVGILFRPLPSDESSLQQNVIMAQTTIFPTLFDLMGLRWASAVADLDPLRLSNDEFVVRNRRRSVMNRVFDHSSSQVDGFLRIPEGERRMDLYRSQETIPYVHPNGYRGPGVGIRDSQMREGYSPMNRLPTEFVPGSSNEGSLNNSLRYEGGLHRAEPEILPPVSPHRNSSSSNVRHESNTTSQAKFHSPLRHVPSARQPTPAAVQTPFEGDSASHHHGTFDRNVRPASYESSAYDQPPRRLPSYLERDRQRAANRRPSITRLPPVN